MYLLRRRSFWALGFATLLAGCGAPRDPQGTSARIQGGFMKVGVAENAPWVRFVGDEPAGVEPQLVREFAQAHAARIQWVRGGESRLLPQLERGELDLVVGGVTSKTPWAAKLGPTRPYVEAAGDRHVWLAAPGENRFLLELDRFLQGRGDEARRLLQAERGA